MKCKLYAVNHSKLSKVPVVSGQLISTKDVSGFYYDMNSKRHALQPKDDVLYSLIPKANTTSTGVSVNIDYSVTSGSLEGDVNVNACVYESLEFVFYDRGTGTQFSARLHGLPYGEDGLYTYNWCNKACASLDTDTTQTVGGTSIIRETVYATGIVLSDGTFRITAKSHISETVADGVVTMTESDITADNRVALLKIVGRR